MKSIIILSNDNNENKKISAILNADKFDIKFIEDKNNFINFLLTSIRLPDIIIINENNEINNIDEIILKIHKNEKLEFVSIIYILKEVNDDKKIKYKNIGVSSVLDKNYTKKELNFNIEIILAQIEKKNRRMKLLFVYTNSETLIESLNENSRNKYLITGYNRHRLLFNDIIFKQPDAILIDENNSGKSNISKLYALIKNNHLINNIPLILLTEGLENNLISEFSGSNICSFIIKPFISEILFMKIYMMIEELKEYEQSAYSFDRRKTELLIELKSLPPFPSNFVRILSVISDPNSSASDLEKYLDNDRVLLNRVMNIANSSFYKGSVSENRIESSKQSITLLGFNLIEALTIVTGTNKLFPKSLLSLGYASDGLWQHSLCAALVAKSIAIDFNMSKNTINDMFLCGMFHDIGKIILGKYISVKDKIFLTPEIGRKNRTNLEKKIAGYSHPEIGEMLVENWNLPTVISETTKHHHQPSLALTTYSKEVSIVSLANFIANSLKIGLQYRNISEPKLYDSIKDNLDINDDYINSLLKRSAQLYKDAADILNKVR